MLSSSALAQPEYRQPTFYKLNIYTSDARVALSELAKQTGTPLLYLDEDLGDSRVNPLVGAYTVEQALEIMLEDSSIRAFLNAEGVIIITIEGDDTEDAVQSATGLEERQPEADTQTEVTRETASRFSGLASQSADEPEVPKEVLITGSRLRKESGMTTAVPVTSITIEELSDYQPSGTIAEQLDILPQFFATQTAQRGGGVLFGSAGGSYLNMRGMGPARTLVLFDGSRVVPADRGSSVNVDTLPVALLRNIEVVTGGASAAYGADALAGVVNFVLDREFEGIRFASGSGITEKNDGHNWNFSLAGGFKLGDRLNVIGSLEARQIHQIERMPADMENFRRWGFVTNPSWNPDLSPGVQPQRLTLPEVHSTLHAPAGLINQPGFRYDRHVFLADGSATRPFVLGDVYALSGAGTTWSQSGGTEAEIANRAFNGGPFGAEVVNRSTFLGLQYALTDQVDVFAQALFGHTESNQNNRRGNPHLQSDTWHATIFRDNVFLPDTVRMAMDEQGLDSIRVDKLGQVRGLDNFNDNKNDRNKHRIRSFTAGVDAQLYTRWNIRATIQHGEADKTTAAHNILRLDRLFMAMDAVRDPDTGAIMCHVNLVNPTPEQLHSATAGVLVPAQSGLIELPAPVGLDNSVRDCIPLNIFGLGNASREAADYVVGTKTGRSTVKQDFAEILLNGDLYESPYGPVSIAVGASWREESLWQSFYPGEFDGPPRNAPELGIRGIPAGFTGGSTSLFQFSGVPRIEGEFDVWELFGEVSLPLWRSQSGGQRLGSNFAFRSSDYSLSGHVNSWKTGLDFALSNSVRVRATRSRDVREATFSERFDTQGMGGYVDDPAFNASNVAITTVAGGNPALNPEVADTSTVGLVYQPARFPWMNGLQFSADWYDIRMREAIGQLGNQQIVDACHEGVESLCDQVTRNNEGILVSVNNLYQNIDAARVRGVDMEILYDSQVDFFSGQTETINLRILAGYLLENSNTPKGGQRYERAGGIDWPEVTAVIAARYSLGPMGITLQQRYIDSTILNLDWEEGVDIDDNSVASQSVTNLGFSYSAQGNNGSSWQLTLNINNVLDREAPVIPSFSQRSGSQTVNNNYDVFGRRYQLSLNYDF